MPDAPTPAQKRTPAQNPAPGDWRNALPEDLTAPGRDEAGQETQIPLRRHPALAKYASAEEALKALVHAQRLLGRKTEPEGSLLSQGSSQGSAQGSVQGSRPESPEDYRLPEVELPEDFRVDTALRGAFLAKAHELDLSDAQAGGLYAWFLPLNVEGLRAHTDKAKAERSRRRERELSSLRQAHGGEAQSVLESARKAVLALGGAALMQALEQSGAADDACVVQAFARMAPLVSESSLRGKNGGAAASLTPQRLREMMRDPRYFDPSRRDTAFVRQVQQGFEALYPGEKTPALRAS
ncbi:MAG: hypothetical protein CVU73_09375 [Deltaproteobacteria bacterium HGW-Deltaproteobacteria-8]|jgi:hypothetical protein|nr:MAG: hypothetical protein CVU73_09375 [Deltaproteobacteria bacterium HGW-Deltaproteobacteria-8]